MCKVANGEDLLQKLKKQVADPTMPTWPPADLIGEAALLCDCSDSCSSIPPQGVPVVSTSISPFQIRKREDFVPATEHEVLEWMAGRHEEMTAALMARNPLRSSAHLEFDHGRNQESSTGVGASFHGHQHGTMTASQDARTVSRYGLPGSRVGEASNPGTPQRIPEQNWSVSS